MRYFADSPDGLKTRAAIKQPLLAGLMLCLALTGCVAAHTKTARKAAQEPQDTPTTTINAPEKTDSVKPAHKAQAPEAKAPNTPINGAPAKTDTPGASESAETPIDSRTMSTTIQQPADFNECVRVALVQSPILVKSSLEIQSKRLDVQDAWAGFIPTLTISTTYWFVVPQAYTTTYQSQYDPVSQTNINVPVRIGTATQKPYSISFSTGQWNPLLSGFDVAAKKELLNMAILGHLKVMSDGLHRLAGDFLQLSALIEEQGVVVKKMETAKSNLEFFKTRQGIGQATQMDIRIAETKIKMAQAEGDSLNAQRTQVTDDIKFILGVPFVNKLDLNVEAAKQEILGSFSAADVTEEKVRAHSFDLRIAGYEQSLQRKNIGLSYVRLLPSFGFTFQTLDAFNNSGQQTNGQFPFYPGINLSMPLDYWTKGRDIVRQYKKLDQQRATARTKEFELMVSAQKALTDYQAATSDWSLADSRLELAKLQDEQTQSHYKTGQVDYDKLSADRAGYYDAWQKLIMGKAKRDLALLALKNITGDLQKQYIDVTSWEK